MRSNEIDNYLLVAYNGLEQLADRLNRDPSTHRARDLAVKAIWALDDVVQYLREKEEEN